MIEIQTHFEAGTPQVLADGTQLHQILMNLGTNASHAMPSGGLLEVRLMPVTVDADQAASLGEIKAGRYARLSITDTGSGMDRATLARIFDPFFTTKGHGKGTGLGLAVVHGIVKSHDGAIYVYSELGKGTSFHLYFPAAMSVAVTDGPPAAPLPRGEGQRILCVDDEPSVLSVMTRRLERLGYRVTSYSEGSTALNDFRAHPGRFDAVITDLALRGMSGLDFSAALRQLRPGIRIILSSGYFSAEDKDRAEDLGIQDLILKPNSLAELADKLYRVLRAS
jgi:CheY-like chemotaxis protein